MTPWWLARSEFESLEASGTTAFRLGRTRSGFVERFGGIALLSAQHAAGVAELRAALEREDFGWQPRSLFARSLVRNPAESDKPVHLAGDAAPIETVLERGLRFEVDLSQSYSPGLFCDQRTNRDFLAARRPHRVLNLFSYTCAFSVAAAAVGAVTFSVDVSKASLRRGLRNLEINNIDPTPHRFFPDDAVAVLGRMARRGEIFDAVIVDPPTFGRTRDGRVFRIERDLPGIVHEAASVLAPGGAMLVSTNYSAWSLRDLETLVAANIRGPFTLARAERQPDFPDTGGSLTLWVVFPQDSERPLRT